METTQFRAVFGGFAAALSLGIALAGCSSTVKRPDGGEGLLPVGSSAPDFAATTKAGDPTRLSALKGAPVVVYFYPKDETPGCTREACAFRDAWDRLQAAGARVWGISADSHESHVAFAREHQLTFPLLPDPELRWATAFGVSTTLGMTDRVTFLVGRDGRIAKVYPDVDPAVHVDQVLADLAALGADPTPPGPAPSRP